MLKFYTGTPGSGKSHNMAFQIRNKLRQGKNIISTVNINTDIVSKNGKRKIGDFKYIPIFELTPEVLELYALHNHEKGREGQTYVFIDECQLIFNTRDFAHHDRKNWLVFFTSHRHYGYEFFLITQNDRMIDRQIRALVEHEVSHKKLNNYMWFLPWTVFIAVERWYGHKQKMKLYSEFILFRPSIANMYDSYTLFDDLIEKYKQPNDDQPSASADTTITKPPEEEWIETCGVAVTQRGTQGDPLGDGDTIGKQSVFARMKTYLTNFFTPNLQNTSIK